MVNRIVKILEESFHKTWKDCDICKNNGSEICDGCWYSDEDNFYYANSYYVEVAKKILKEINND